MCYGPTDELLKKAELAWRQEYQRMWGDATDDEAHEAQDNWYYQFHQKHKEACCSDVLVAIADDTEKMKWGYDATWSMGDIPGHTDRVHGDPDRH